MQAVAPFSITMKVVPPQAKHKAISSQFALSSFGLLSLRLRFPREEGTSNEGVGLHNGLIIGIWYVGRAILGMVKEAIQLWTDPHIAL